MKKEEKAKKAMEHLAIAFNCLPNDTDFEDPKREIKKTLNKLETSLKKRIKRKEIQQSPLESWNNNVSQWVANAVDPKRSLAMLDKMLEVEKKKLANIQNDGKEETLLG